MSGAVPGLLVVVGNDVRASMFVLGPGGYRLSSGALLAAWALSPHIRVFVIPAVLDAADPPVLDHHPHETQRKARRSLSRR